MNREMVTGLLAAAVFVAVSAFSATYAKAACTSSKVGNFTYHNCDNGYNATESKVGNFTYGQDNEGHNWTKNRVGDFEYTNEY